MTSAPTTSKIKSNLYNKGERFQMCRCVCVYARMCVCLLHFTPLQLEPNWLGIKQRALDEHII